MTIRRWSMLLLGSFLGLMPSVAVAQATQSQTSSSCSPNLHESNNNSITIGGDCRQNVVVNNTYNGPVYQDVHSQTSPRNQEQIPDSESGSGLINLNPRQLPPISTPEQRTRYQNR